MSGVVMTYGEWLYQKRDALHIENGEWVVDMSAAPRRMSRMEATRYYGWKLERVWRALGYERRNDMTREEAAKELGYKNTAPIARMVKIGTLEDDGSGGVTNDSVERYKKKKRSERVPFVVDEEPQKLESAKQVLLSREYIEQKIIEAFELGKKEGYEEACRKFATDEEIDVARIVAERR